MFLILSRDFIDFISTKKLRKKKCIHSNSEISDNSNNCADTSIVTVNDNSSIINISSDTSVINISSDTSVINISSDISVITIAASSEFESSINVACNAKLPMLLLKQRSVSLKNNYLKR